MTPRDPRRLLSRLTEREEEVLELVCDGLSYEDIADRLFIEVSTVKSHASKIRAKLQVANNVELVKVYGPLLGEDGPSARQAEAPEEAEPAPQPAMQGEPFFLEEPPPPRRPKWFWLLVGGTVGMCLAVVLTVGIISALNGLRGAEEKPEAKRGVTVEVTSTREPSQPSPTSEAVVADTATPEDMPAPEDTPTSVPPSATPMPTETPVPPTPTPPPTSTPTPTPLPTPTVPQDTPPGTVLAVGETWKTRGFHARLDRVDFIYGSEARLYFTLRNTTGKTLFFYFNEEEHVTMEDDLGRFFTWHYKYENNLVLEPGQSYTEQVYKGGNFSGASYFIITLDLPDLIYAQWRYN